MELRGMMANRDITPISVTDAATEQIRRKIFGRQFPPGGLIKEAAIAAELGYARDTVRSALARLESESLLERSPRRGWMVRDISADDLIDLTVARQAVEMQAVYQLCTEPTLSPHNAREHLELLRKLNDAELERRIEADLEFHRALVADAGSARLVRMYDGLMNELLLGLSQSEEVRTLNIHGATSGSGLRNHIALFEAVERRDLASATELLREHRHDRSVHLEE